MTASISDSLSAKEKALFSLALISLVLWQFPLIGKAYAQTVNTENASQIFEIKSQVGISDNDLQKQKSLEDQLLAEQTEQQNINQQVTLLQSYLQSKNSPLAPYSSYLIGMNNWKTIIAVSNSESTMGQHCYYNNCSGIFGPNGLKTYKTVPDWINDMNQLLNKRYQGMSLAAMDGVYVYPRSTSWYQASSSVYSQLSDLQQQFPAQAQTN